MAEFEYSRNFKGVWIPAEIYLDNRLSALDKIVLVEIISLDNPENHCYASNEYLAGFCQVSVPTITRSLSKLIELGYISQVTFNGRNRVLQSNIETVIRQTNQNDDGASSKRLSSKINLMNHLNQNDEDINIENKKENIKKNNTKKSSILNPDGFSSTGTENAFGYNSLENFNMKKKKTRSIQEMIDDYTQNERFRRLLENFVPIWRSAREEKQFKVYPNIFQGFLNQLDEDGKDDDERMEIVKYCTNYSRFTSISYEEMKKRQSNSKKFSQPKLNISQQVSQEDEDIEQIRKENEAYLEQLRKEGRQTDF